MGAVTFADAMNCAAKYSSFLNVVSINLLAIESAPVSDFVDAEERIENLPASKPGTRCRAPREGGPERRVVIRLHDEPHPPWLRRL